jgi:UDP-N-acetyl-2-amino-2-deoxyglucuronate dehydrogenase
MLTIALIGCGRISFKHIEGFVKNSNRMSLIAVCDPMLDRAQARSQEYKKYLPDSCIAIYSDYREMLAQCKPDVVTIATESGYHSAIAIDCLNAGCHVICEKPMALSTADADTMNKVANKNGRKLAVCFQNRFNAAVQKTRSAYEAGRFGRMLHGMIQVRWNRDEKYYSEASWRGTWDLDGGTLLNQCTHGIDLLQWLMGEDVVKVYGVTRKFLRPIEAEDFGSAILEFKNGAVGIIEGSADVFPTNLNETLSLFGQNGCVVIGGLAVNKIETWRFSDSREIGDPEEIVLGSVEKDPPSVYGYGHVALFADFLDAVEQNRDPLVSGEKAKKALEIILAIYKSMKESRAIDLPIQFSTTEMKKMSGPNHG